MSNEIPSVSARSHVTEVAVGVMIGIACYKAVASLFEHVILPPIGYLVRESEFFALTIELPVEGADPVEIKYGLFLTAFVSLILMLLVVKLVTLIRRRLRAPAKE